MTVEHLLALGIGDYVDEDAMKSALDHVLPVPVHRRVGTEDHLAVLDGHPQVSPPGERFTSDNSGFVVLALIAERVGGAPFAVLVQSRAGEPAGPSDTAFLRSDEPAGRTALGYLAADGLRTNVLLLPVCGSGDRGACTTAADVSAL